MQKIKKQSIGWLLYWACLLGGICMSCVDSNDDKIYSTLYGVVTDYTTGKPVEGATLTLSPSSYTRQSDTAGAYCFERLDAQQYTITVQKKGYHPNRKTITADSGEEREVNIPLTQIENNSDN